MSGSRIGWWLATSAIVAAAFVLGSRGIETPGLYYDEVVQARPALEFLEGKTRGTPLPGSHTSTLFGRPFPVTTQLYMGALKSQLLIPSFWAFGSETTVLRMTTLACALAGLLLVAAWARRAIDPTTAWISAALLAFDPSFLLIARHDWGSFALSLALRGAALLFARYWWQTKSAVALCAAALAVGLAGYNKVDAAIFFAAAIGAIGFTNGHAVIAALRQRPTASAAALAAGLLGLGPLLWRLTAILSAGSTLSEGSAFGEKLHTLTTMLDGSYFYRLMASGGLFEELGAVAGAPAGPLLWLLIPSVAWVAFLATASSHSDEHTRRCALFLLLANGLAVLGVIALPGGVRIHHALNIYPLPHLLVGFGFATAFARAPGRLSRRLLTLAVVAVLMLEIASFWRTFELFGRSGGKGRWTDATFAVAADLEEHRVARVLSLDWGLHEPLAFLSSSPRFAEVPLSIAAGMQRSGTWSFDGSADDLYVAHPARYDLFGYGPLFLEAASQIEPEFVTLRSYRDREGDEAIVAVRFSRPHRLVFLGGRFEIRF